MILVTGGTGLVGSHLLFHLTENEGSVRAIYRSESSREKVKEIFSLYTETPDINFAKIDWIQADITDVPSMIIAFENVTHVYHVAAIISFKPKDYIEMRKVNIHGTAIIANLSIDFGVKKLCFVSSIAAISENAKKEFIDEENEFNGNEKNGGYAITKYGGEMEIWRASQEGVDVIIVNPGVVLGPGFWYSGSGKLFSQVAKGISFYTEGITGFISVDDVVKSMIQLMKSNIVNERFILVAENKSFKEVLFAIAKALDVKPTSKKASVFASEVFWRWEYLKSKITGKSPRLTRAVAKSLHSKTSYKNDKIVTALGIEFKGIEKVINEVAVKYTS